MKKIIIIAIFAYLMIPGSLWASNTVQPISKIRIFKDYDRAYITVSDPNLITQRPACSDNAYYQYVLDTSTSAGKQLLSLLITAHTTGNNINFAGTTACSQISNIEDLLAVGLE